MPDMYIHNGVDYVQACSLGFNYMCTTLSFWKRWQLGKAPSSTCKTWEQAKVHEIYTFAQELVTDDNVTIDNIPTHKEACFIFHWSPNKRQKFTLFLVDRKHDSIHTIFYHHYSIQKHNFAGILYRFVHTILNYGNVWGVQFSQIMD